jgi:hypothetical protein
MVNGETQQRAGACHCGAVKFVVMLPAELRGARCDCSICSMKGAVTVGAPLDGLTVFEGKELLTLYQFNTKTAKHFFCSKCGSYTFHQRRSDPDTYGVNVACLGLNPYHDFPDVAVVDGIHHSRDTGKMRLAGRLKFEENPD